MTTSNASDIFGGSVPVGAIVQGQFKYDSKYLPCDGVDRLRASYPDLDCTGLETFGTNTPNTSTLPRAALWSVASGAGLLVAVAPGGLSGYATSSDGGATWTARTFPVNFDASYATIIFTGVLFVVATGAAIYTSADGINWVLRYTAAGNVSKLLYAGSLVFGFDATGTATTYYTSPDGITWTSRTAIAPGPSGMAFFRGVYLMCFSGTAATNTFAMSTNGVANWYSYSVAMASGTMTNANWVDVVANGAGVYYVGSTYNDIYFSPDGFTGGVFVTPASLAIGKTSPKRAFSINGAVFITSASSGNVAMFRDPATLQVLPLIGSGIYSLAVDYSGNVVASQLASTSAISILATDLTKFRTPNMRRLTDGDRYYIKAK